MHGLPAGVGADEAVSLTGHRLYTQVLQRMRDELGLAFLQPGRFLMPSPGAQPPWMQFFPLPGRSPLAKLMEARFSAYVNAVRSDLMSPMFADLDSLVVLADLLSALHQGQAAFTDAQLALTAAADALRWERTWTDYLAAFAQLKLPPIQSDGSPLPPLKLITLLRVAWEPLSSHATHHSCATWRGDVRRILDCLRSVH